jgi:hypothetical protein
MRTMLGVVTVLLLWAVPVGADPITITGGALTTVGVFGSNSFTLTGEGVSFVGGGDPGFAAPSGCSPCMAGDLVNMNGRFVGDFTLGSGPATVNGVSYPKVYYAGVLDFQAEAVTFPVGSSNVELTSPFVLTSGPSNGSFLEGFLTSNLQGPVVFNVDLTGGGLVTATFREGATPGLFDFQQVTYSFLASPEPVPEPTSVLLLATGLVGAGVRRWRRGRKT